MNTTVVNPENIPIEPDQIIFVNNSKKDRIQVIPIKSPLELMFANLEASGEKFEQPFEEIAELGFKTYHG